MREAGQPRGKAEMAGVLLHGRGGAPEQMLELAERLAIGGMRWLAPAAEGGSWYPYRFMEAIAANEPFLSRAVDECHHAIDEASDAGRLDPSRIVLIGFSQGACLASEYVLRHSGRCSALVMFTGGLIGPPGTTWRPLQLSLQGLQVLLTGSDIDDWVPEARVRETAEMLAELGASVRLRIYEGRPHVVGDEELGEARRLIQDVQQLALR